MAELYVVNCTFLVKEDDPAVSGLAICSDPDTVVTFIMPDGQAVKSRTIWAYHLHHRTPWAKFEIH